MNKLSESGFTIVELLVTIVIASVLVGSVSLIASAHSRITQRARDLAIANSFVENKIESLRSAGFLGVTIGTTSITSELPAELKAPRSGSLSISAYSSAVKQADISITYNDQGTARTYSYTTLIGELGVGQY